MQISTFDTEQNAINHWKNDSHIKVFFDSSLNNYHTHINITATSLSFGDISPCLFILFLVWQRLPSGHLLGQSCLLG